MKLKSVLTFGTFVVFAAGTLPPAFAAPPAQDNKAPLDQASESVEKNRQKNPDNPGLENAAERLETNRKRIEEHRDTVPPSMPGHSRPAHHDHDRPARPNRAERGGGGRH